MKIFWVLLIIIIISLLCFLYSKTSGPFARYLENELNSRGIQIEVKRCLEASIFRSRSGICVFTVDQDQQGAIKKALNLTLVAEPGSNVIHNDNFKIYKFIFFSNCPEFENFTNRRKVQDHDYESEFSNDDVQIFKIENGLKHDHPSNIKTNIKTGQALLYSADRNEYCIDLEHPYG